MVPEWKRTNQNEPDQQNNNKQTNKPTKKHKLTQKEKVKPISEMLWVVPVRSLWAVDKNCSAWGVPVAVHNSETHFLSVPSWCLATLQEIQLHTNMVKNSSTNESTKLILFTKWFKIPNIYSIQYIAWTEYIPERDSESAAVHQQLLEENFFVEKLSSIKFTCWSSYAFLQTTHTWCWLLCCKILEQRKLLCGQALICW